MEDINAKLDKMMGAIENNGRMIQELAARLGYSKDPFVNNGHCPTDKDSAAVNQGNSDPGLDVKSREEDTDEHENSTENIEAQRYDRGILRTKLPTERGEEKTGMVDFQLGGETIPKFLESHMTERTPDVERENDEETVPSRKWSKLQRSYSSPTRMTYVEGNSMSLPKSKEKRGKRNRRGPQGPVAAVRVEYRPLDEICLSKAFLANFTSILDSVEIKEGTLPPCVNLDFIRNKQDHKQIQAPKEAKSKLRIFLIKLSEQSYDTMDRWLLEIDESVRELILSTYAELQTAVVRKTPCFRCQLQTTIPIINFADCLVGFLPNRTLTRIYEQIGSDRAEEHELYDELFEKCRKMIHPKIMFKIIGKLLEQSAKRRQTAFASKTYQYLHKDFNTLSEVADLVSCKCEENMALKAFPAPPVPTKMYVQQTACQTDDSNSSGSSSEIPNSKSGADSLQMTGRQAIVLNQNNVSPDRICTVEPERFTGGRQLSMPHRTQGQQSENGMEQEAQDAQDTQFKRRMEPANVTRKEIERNAPMLTENSNPNLMMNHLKEAPYESASLSSTDSAYHDAGNFHLNGPQDGRSIADILSSAIADED